MQWWNSILCWWKFTEVAQKLGLHCITPYSFELKGAVKRMHVLVEILGTHPLHYQETPVQPNAGVGILLKPLVVVDADSAEEVTRWDTEWPMLHSVPMETTSKGAHYYFRRTTLCNELGLTNGPLNEHADNWARWARRLSPKDGSPRGGHLSTRNRFWLL